MPLLLLGFSLAYFLAARLGIATSMPPAGIVILWPPNAIVLVTLLAVSRDKWWLFFLVTVATEIAADVPYHPLWAAAGYGIVNFSEGAIAAYLLSKFSRGSLSLASVHDFLRFLAIGPILASGTAALFGAAIYKIGAPELDYLHYWRVFWLGDALGLLIIGTTLLAWRRPAALPIRSGPFALAERVLLALGLVTASLWAFLAEADAPLVYLIFPFLMWAALRFGVRETSLAIVATVAVSVGASVMGYGPFATLSHIDSVIALQGLIAVVALSTFMIAFSAEESVRTTSQLRQSVRGHGATESKLRQAYKDLERINRELDQTVADRTRQLRKTVARNEMLLKEVHHRVKNNLQLMSSLLALHGRNLAAPLLQEKLAQMQGQVSAIAATYDVLYQMESVEVVDFCRIVPQLCQNIASATGDLVSVTPQTSGSALVTADAAVALSLALNELITNSIKTAAEGDGKAVVIVDCGTASDNVHLSIADNGPGFPPDFDIDHAEGFGMRMVRSLVTQTGGKLRLADSDAGAVVEITVPLAADPE